VTSPNRVLHHARISIYAILIVILTIAAASAQTDKPGLPGYSNAARTDQEKKNDRELDHAYESTIKGRPDAKKNTDPWADVRSAPPTAAKNKQKSMPAGRFPPPWSVEEQDAYFVVRDRGGLALAYVDFENEPGR
jgi:hypothetical protein